MLVQIFLNTIERPGGYQPHHILTLVHTYHEPTAGVAPLSGAVDAYDKPVLDRVFLLFTHIHTDIHTRDYFDAGNRSLTTGDVVAIDGRYYACTNTDWQALHAPLHARLHAAAGGGATTSRT
ncbi:hypothetical protein C5E45_20825 [Nocardia nova]|uniref:Uncharacterized protein n=1 Tax=Nocardia nova TaxID=37330 RepID=A0A2S6AMP3_9NOCA|nr:hypothetical protein [Nocardia nova]PPJ36490.1 hypothetical protein C5E45_20825 [Nocardia nova]